jgi:hypothetical protein
MGGVVLNCLARAASRGDVRAMFFKDSCKCLHCGEMFQVDARNRGRQRHCRKVPCRKARKAASQRRWLAKPDNADYFRDEANVRRVQAWRKRNPGYSRRSGRQRSQALQDPSIPQTPSPQQESPADAALPLQDLCGPQAALLVGLIAQLTGMTLQDDIAEATRRLHSRGRAVLGVDVQRSAYGKPTQTPDPPPPTAARAAFV